MPRPAAPFVSGRDAPARVSLHRRRPGRHRRPPPGGTTIGEIADYPL